MTTQDSLCRRAYFDEAMALHDTLQTWVPRLMVDDEPGDGPSVEFAFWAIQINDEFRLLHERMQWVLSMGHAVEAADLECLRDIARRATELNRLTRSGEKGTI